MSPIGDRKPAPHVSPEVPLGALNRRVHAGLEELLMRALEALTALDLAAARTEFARFAGALRLHARLEDEVVVPAYAALGDHPRGGGPELFNADHLSLRKVLDQCEVELDALGPTPGRRAMVRALPTLLRARSVLEHHDLREERFLYVRLDAELTRPAAAALRDALQLCLDHLDHSGLDRLGQP